jgi:hypothetical protein
MRKWDKSGNRDIQTKWEVKKKASNLEGGGKEERMNQINVNAVFANYFCDLFRVAMSKGSRSQTIDRKTPSIRDYFVQIPVIRGIPT